METLAANFLKFSGSFSDHRTVMFGSGDGKSHGVQGVQEAEAVFGDQSTAINAHTYR